jgi:hypothetical protein
MNITEKHIIVGVVGAAFLIMLLTASLCVAIGHEIPSNYWEFLREIGSIWTGAALVAFAANGASRVINGRKNNRGGTNTPTE